MITTGTLLIEKGTPIPQFFSDRNRVVSECLDAGDHES